MKWRIIIWLVVVILVAYIPFSFGQVLSDPLNGGSVGDIYDGIFVSEGGWTPVNWDDMIRYNLQKYYIKGRFFIDVRNFDPPNQNSAARHHILSMYADSIGDHNHRSYIQGDSTEKSVWNLHTGTHYHDGFKLLSVAGDKIETYAQGFTWNPDSTYRFSVFWDQDTVRFFIDSVLIIQNINSQNFCLRNVFIGRDYTHSLDIDTGLPNNEYPAMPGPIYANLVIYGDSPAPVIKPNDPVEFSVDLPQTGDVYSFDLDIKYNPEWVELDTVRKNTNEIMLFYNDVSGLLKIGAYSARNIVRRDSVVTIRFLPHPDTSEVRFAHFRSTRFLVNATEQPPFCNSYVVYPLDSLKSLPVELSFFNVFGGENSSAELEWRTESERDNYGFEIQRKSGQEKYRKIGFVKGNGTSSEPHFYHYTNRNLSAGEYYYRIKQIDLEGTFSYTEEKYILIGMPKQFGLLPNYPNPFTKKTRIPFSLSADAKYGSIQIDIYDIRGRFIKNLLHNISKGGKRFVDWDGSDQFGVHLPAGVYFGVMKMGQVRKARKILIIR
ncbi:MAG TPA: hypothetical protein ENH29_00010 [Bacteroidetes bacterium]|nr:hypothetical protein [Bacteroidota bacterium]